MDPRNIADLISDDILVNNGLISEAKKTTIPTRKLGKTGRTVGIMSLGGESTIKLGTEKEAQEIIERAFELGITYIDTAPAYGPKTSEERIGKVIASGIDRKSFYLATKCDKRTYEPAWKQINQSIERLQTTPDCIQIHHLDEMSEVEQIFDKRNGAMKALWRAQDEGLCKYLGITGHSDPTVLLEALKRYKYNTVLGALNIADQYSYSFQSRLLPYCAENNIGFIAMKVCARGAIFRKDHVETMKECLDYVWSVPGVSTAIVGISTVEQLEHNVKLAKKHKTLTTEQLLDLEKKVRPYSDKALYFRRGHDWTDARLPTDVKK